MERLKSMVVEKSVATEEKTYIVIPELKFTDAMLNDPTPMTVTMKELFDLFVESGELVEEETTEVL